MNKTMIRLYAALLVGSGTAAALQQHAYAVEKSRIAPPCNVAAMQPNQPNIDLAQYRGQVVYLDFWASWCGSCAQSFPFMNELHRDLAPRGVQIVGVSVDETRADAQRFLAKRPGEFQLAIDSAGLCPQAFNVQAMPSSYVIDREGVVRYSHVGFKPSDMTEIRAAIEKVLSEDSITADVH